MLSWRLLLSTGEDRYADLIERTLLNNVLASPRADGRAFYYTNTLHQRTPGQVPDEQQLSHRAESGLRAPWFEVSCCPTNVARTLASVSLYFATASDDGLQLHQYGDYRVSTELAAGTVTVQVSSAYPGRRHGLGGHHRGARGGDDPPAAGPRLGVRHRRGERERRPRGPRPTSRSDAPSAPGTRVQRHVSRPPRGPPTPTRASTPPGARSPLSKGRSCWPSSRATCRRAGASTRSRPTRTASPPMTPARQPSTSTAATPAATEWPYYAEPEREGRGARPGPAHPVPPVGQSRSGHDAHLAPGQEPEPAGVMRGCGVFGLGHQP